MAIELSARLDAARRFYENGDFALAESELRAVLDHGRDNADALALLGVMRFKTSKVAEAVECFDAALRTEPDHYDALTWLALVRKSNKDVSGAIELLQRAVTLQPDDASAISHLGLCWLSLNRSVPAADAFKKLIRMQPEAAQGYYNLGMALKLEGGSFEAFYSFKKAIELDPDNLQCYVQIFKQLQLLLNWKDGLPLFESGLQRRPDSIALMISLAVTNGKLGKPDKAERLFKKAWNVNAIAGPPYAHWLHEEGRFEEAKEILQKTVQLDPLQAQAYHNLAVAKCFEFDGQTLADRVQSVLGHKGFRVEERMYLQYALALSFEHRKQFEIAMGHFDRANELAYHVHNLSQNFDHKAIGKSDERMMRTYSKEFIERYRRHGSTSEAPVFIVGMIRSGTTLLDQILSSHSRVSSAGEQPFWGLSAMRVDAKWETYGVDVADIPTLADTYLEVLEAVAGSALRATDKMPVNYRHLGLISVAFPNAKIIHLRRNPLDTCLSIYTTYLGASTNFAYNQRNIVENYREYLYLMDHWRSVLPSSQMIELDYEQLVSDKEPVIRGLIEFCGLDWDDACLHHERNASQVSTPSLFTARQAVNAASVEKWRLYEPWLGTLSELKGLCHPKVASQIG